MYVHPGTATLLGEVPSHPPSRSPVFDVAAQFACQVVSMAHTGHVVGEGDARHFDKNAAPGSDAVCSCGAAAPGYEYYVTEPNMFGRVVGPLALHTIMFHRDDVPVWVVAMLEDYARAALQSAVHVLKVPEPAGCDQLRGQAQTAAAIRILKLTRVSLRQTNRTQDLVGALTEAISEVGYERVGWLPTDPGPQAVNALFGVVRPDWTDPISRLYQRELLDDWACDPRRTLEAVFEMLERAITVLSHT
jgi:hypothetical protein